MPRNLSCLVFTALLGACTGSGGEPGVGTCFDGTGQSFTPCRVFRGRMKLPAPKQMQLTTQGLQLAGVAFSAMGGAPAGADGSSTTALSDGGSTPDTGLAPDARAALPPTDRTQLHVFFGPVFAHDEGAGQRPDIPFSIVVPCALSVNLVLQAPRSSSSGAAGPWVAALSFPDEEGGATTTLIPHQADDVCGGSTSLIDLGEVTLTLATEKVLSTGVITLGKDNSKNPLSLLDTDGDGTDDLADADDDDDGQIDAGDVDSDGDGIIDDAELLTALPDDDKNGVPDLFQ